MKNRRQFLETLAGSAAAGLVLGSPVPFAQAAGVPLSFNPATLAFTSMPQDFTGLSYEMPQLYNPRFFSPQNRTLIDAFRKLSANGVLRVGGNLSDLARWQSPAGDFATDKQTAAIAHGKTYWEWKLTDESVRANKDGAITPEAIHALRGFLDATNWRLIYGLNFGSGSPERAADEASYVYREIGDRLISFQVGNESDFFGGNRFFRERGFNFDLYLEGYNAFVSAVRAKVPNAPFSGPDTANNMSWVGEFARQVGRPIVLLSSHYYAMGPAKDPAMDAARLLKPNPHLDQQIALAKAASVDAAGVPFRMTEGNSCFGGGKPGLSDAFASAIWGADYMLHVASSGYAGVNLHGGGDGIYTPIETVTDSAAVLRPLYFGMQFADRFAGHDVAQVTLPDDSGVTTYAGRAANVITQAAFINKSGAEQRVQVPADWKRRKIKEEMLLSAPGIAAKEGVKFATTSVSRGNALVLAPYSARLIVWA